MSDSLPPHGLQHTRLPCPSPTSGVSLNSCPLSQWCHPTISSSVIPFSSCLQSFPAWESFPVSQFFASGGQSIEASASASVLPMNIQDWLDRFAVQATLKSLLQHHSSKASILWCSASLQSNPHIHKWPLGYSPEGHKELDTTEHDHKTRWTTWLLSGREESFNDG